MSAVLFHIDVNSAFLSWTAAEKIKSGNTTDLRLIPSIIGGDEKSRHGIVLAKSTPAKAYGIRTGETVASALRKCPILTVVSPDHKLYSRRSHQMMELLHSYTSDLEQLSIDECFLDFGPIAFRFSSPLDAATQIRDRIWNELGFTVNIGISSNKLLAKMASDFEKPNRIHTLFPEEIPAKMWPLPVGDLYMVGHSSTARLEELGIHTIGDLAHADPDFLYDHFKKHGIQMWNYANGIDSSQVISENRDRKGVGNSITLSQDALQRSDVLPVLLHLAEKVSERLRKSAMVASSVSVEIKYSDFSSCSHQMLLNTPGNSSKVLYDTACRLFDELWNQTPIRLLGVRTTKLQAETDPVQISLFDFGLTPDSDAAPLHPSLDKFQKVDAAMDAIRIRYGQQAVVRGTLLSSPQKNTSSDHFTHARQLENDSSDHFTHARQLENDSSEHFARARHQKE